MATSVLQLQPEEQTLRKLTIAEYHKLVEAGVLHPKERVELLDGLLVQMAPIGPRHQSIVDQLTEEFSVQNKGRYKVSPGRPIPIPDFNEPQPDMVLFKRGVPADDISVENRGRIRRFSARSATEKRVVPQLM